MVRPLQTKFRFHDTVPPYASDSGQIGMTGCFSISMPKSIIEHSLKDWSTMPAFYVSNEPVGTRAHAISFLDPDDKGFVAKVAAMDPAQAELCASWEERLELLKQRLGINQTLPGAPNEGKVAITTMMIGHLLQGGHMKRGEAVQFLVQSPLKVAIPQANALLDHALEIAGEENLLGTNRLLARQGEGVHDLIAKHRDGGKTN